MGCKGSKSVVQATTPLNRVKDIAANCVPEPSTLQQSPGEEGRNAPNGQAEVEVREEQGKEEDREMTVRVRSFHMLVEDTSNPKLPTPKSVLSSQPAPHLPLGKSGSQVMLNVLYDEPITNAELELQRTLAEGRFRLDEIHKREDASVGPLDEPKEAFVSGNSL